MDTVPPQVIDQPLGPRPPRFYVVSGRRVIAIVVVIAALIVAAVAGIAIHRAVFGYDPLVAGCCEGTFQSVRHVDAPEYKGAVVYDYAPGERIQWGFTILNSGKRTVRISALPPTPTTPYMRRVAVDMQDPRTNGGLIGPWQPFRPFTLRPQQSRQFRVTYQFSQCDTAPAGTGFSWDRQPVKFEVWGVSRQTEVAFNQIVAIDRAGGEC